MFRDTAAQDQVVHVKRAPAWGKLLFLVLLAIGCIAAARPVLRWLGGEPVIPLARLTLAEVKRGTLVRDVSAQGTIVAARSPMLYAQAAGVVRFEVEAGAAVQAQQLLAVVESPELQSELRRERATLDSLRAEADRQRISNRKAALGKAQALAAADVALRAATRESERSAKAFAVHAISDVDYQRALDALTNAKSARSLAEQDVQLDQEALTLELKQRQSAVARQALVIDELERQVAGLELRAPFAGVVGTLSVADRTQVTANAPLLKLVDLGELEVEALIPESYADDLVPGQRAEVTLNGAKRDGEIRLISPEVSNAQVAARIVLSGEGRSGLRQNQRVSVRVLLEERANVLLVERGRFVDAAGGRFAYRVQGEQALRTPVNTGATSLSAIEIVSGLKQGDQIVISDTEDFRDAETVRLTE